MERCEKCHSYVDICKRYGCVSKKELQALAGRVKTLAGRAALAEQLRIQFENLREMCDIHNICPKCWKALPDGIYDCYCDRDE